jgi:uncharacterized membrane protein YbaN (DUF454 family)
MSTISNPELRKPSAFARLGALFCSRPLLIAFGWLNVGLGMVGAILPVMPTTVFMLMALWAFSKSSPRFHRWLYTHPRFGPVLQDWQQERAIPGPAKALALTVMAGASPGLARPAPPLPWCWWSQLDWGCLRSGSLPGHGPVARARRNSTDPQTVDDPFWRRVL